MASTLAWLSAARAAPERVVGQPDHFTKVHLSSVQVLVVKVQAVLKNDPKPG
jgi:hypothetical protein